MKVSRKQLRKLIIEAVESKTDRIMRLLRSDNPKEVEMGKEILLSLTGGEVDLQADLDEDEYGIYPIEDTWEDTVRSAVGEDEEETETAKEKKRNSNNIKERVTAAGFCICKMRSFDFQMPNAAKMAR